MQELSNIYVNDEFNNAFQKTILKLDTFSQQVGSSSSVHESISDSFKFSFFSWAEGQSEFEKTVYRIIFDYCARAEKMGPGSFRSCLETITDLVKNFHGSNKDLGDLRSKIFYTLFQGARHPSVQEIKKLVRAAASDEIIFELLWSAVELSGIEGKISIEKTPSKTPSVELINGYNFDLKCAFETTSWKQKNAKVLVVDGVVESVAECDKILSSFSQSKEPLVFFARGFHEEVILTLKTNFNRRTLNITPFAVPFDAEGINTLKDLAVVSNTDIISSLKGQLISCIKTEDIAKVDEITYKDGIVTIINSASQGAVAKHSKYLVEQKVNASAEFAAELYDRRIKTITPSCAILRLPEKLMATEKVEIALHTFRSSVSFGLVDTSEFIRECGNILVHPTFQSRFSKILSDIGKNEKLPANYVVAVLKYSIDCYKALKSIGAVVSL